MSCSVLSESASFPFEVASPCVASLSCLFLRRVALFVLLALFFFTCLVPLTAGESSDSRVPYDVSVVSEFVDVFPNEIFGLPLD